MILIFYIYTGSIFKEYGYGGVWVALIQSKSELYAVEDNWKIRQILRLYVFFTGKHVAC